jgi:hypothetical protein
LLAAGCGGDSSTPTWLARDSAGIAIVENAGPKWRAGQGWRVEATPLLQIGELDGDEPYVFSSIGGAARLSDGSIVVADGRSRQLRFFDSAGEHVRTIGRLGAGPGEFQIIAALLPLVGDSLLVVDPASRRISIAHATAGVVRSLRMPDSLTVFRPLGLAGEQSVFGYSALVESGVSGGRDSLDVWELRLDGTGGRRIARLAGQSREYARGFGPMPAIALTTDGFWYGSGDTYEFRHHTLDATLERITRMPHTPVAVPPEMIAAVQEQQAEAASRFGPTVPDLPVPDYLPPFAGAITDTEGNLWVWPMGTGREPVWSVLSPEGHYLGDVVPPNGFVPFEIGADYILTRAWDEYQVEYLQLYRLVKPGS